MNIIMKRNLLEMINCELENSCHYHFLQSRMSSVKGGNAFCIRLKAASFIFIFWPLFAIFRLLPLNVVTPPLWLSFLFYPFLKKYCTSLKPLLINLESWNFVYPKSRFWEWYLSEISLPPSILKQSGDGKICYRLYH